MKTGHWQPPSKSVTTTGPRHSQRHTADIFHRGSMSRGDEPKLSYGNRFCLISKFCFLIFVEIYCMFWQSLFEVMWIHIGNTLILKLVIYFQVDFDYYRTSCWSHSVHFIFIILIISLYSFFSLHPPVFVIWTISDISNIVFFSESRWRRWKPKSQAYSQGYSLVYSFLFLFTS